MKTQKRGCHLRYDGRQSDEDDAEQFVVAVSTRVALGAVRGGDGEQCAMENPTGMSRSHHLVSDQSTPVAPRSVELGGRSAKNGAKKPCEQDHQGKTVRMRHSLSP